jgi:hypothetical protein
VVLSRAVADLRAPALVELLTAAIEVAEEALEAGAIVAVGRTDVRVRRLPLHEPGDGRWTGSRDVAGCHGT